MDVKIASKDGRPSRMSALRLSRAERDSAEASAEQVIVDMSPADRLKGLTATEIKGALSTKQTAGLKRALLDDAERTPAWDQGYRAAMVRVAEVATSPHFAGREMSAIELLANDKLSSAEINSLLSRQPAKADDNAELIAMLKNENQDLGSYGDEFGNSGEPSDLMKSAHAKAKERRGQFASPPVGMQGRG